MERFLNFYGIIVILGLAWLLSSNRKSIPFRLIFSGVMLQIIFGMLILWTTPGQFFFDAARVLVTKVISFSNDGARMVFGEDFHHHFVAFSVLSTIIFVSASMAVLFHLGIMQQLVKAMAWIMVKVMNVSGSESLSTSANIFIGQTEAPLVVKPYIDTMTRSEIMAMMTGGMATIAGGVMAAYVSFGADPGHLLAASFMSAPASLVIAKLMIPELEDSNTKGIVRIDVPKTDANILDAACRGASEGVRLCINVAAMLIAFIAFTSLINYVLSFFPYVSGDNPLTVQRILGWIFVPLAWTMGVSWSDCPEVGQLLGVKMFLNEFVAYLDLMKLQGSISPRSFIIATYALCGFANFSSIAIQIGGIGGLVPTRRKDIAKLGVKSMIGGTLAANMTATIAGMLID